MILLIGLLTIHINVRFVDVVEGPYDSPRNSILVTDLWWAMEAARGI